MDATNGTQHDQYNVRRRGASATRHDATTAAVPVREHQQRRTQGDRLAQRIRRDLGAFLASLPGPPPPSIELLEPFLAAPAESARWACVLSAATNARQIVGFVAGEVIDHVALGLALGGAAVRRTVIDSGAQNAIGQHPGLIRLLCYHHRGASTALPAYLVSSSIHALTARGADCVVLLAWSSPNQGLPIAAALRDGGFRRYGHVDAYWARQPATARAGCTVCGPTCRCAALLFLRPYGATPRASYEPTPNDAFAARTAAP